ncbi:hypothetical protein G5B40_13095 [Pikeienuella piscinae]|uniref:DUF2938 domain-containing protein n=1 Tax=Pikeienuella piscinae TaxID=2748098 RepID=A0A7L5C0N0_9RHOB|nr:hypothetical protein [Pikeienuella piscinae]QIE56317.1 hypothetical protein G5B40_13095 [Pikeienuella piscinae]
MTTTDTPTAALALIFAGALATIAFDLFGQGVSPALGFANLSPVGLANSTLEALTGAPWTPGAQIMHYATGLIAYPLGWLLIVRPLWRGVAPGLHWALPAALYGAGLWIFALFIMANLVAGLPAFLNFTGIAWVALIGHVIFALVAAWTMETRRFV